MKNLRTIAKIIGSVLMGACVGSALANAIKGDAPMASLMGGMSVVNLMRVIVLVVWGDEG